MAVQLNYIAKEGWEPQNPDEDYLIAQYRIELAKGIDESRFVDAAASVAAESSTGTWTKVEDRPDSGLGRAEEYKALVYDLVPEKNMFKVAYRQDLFEPGNISGFLAGPAGNIAGMKMLSGLRIYDLRFPRPLVESFPGPRYGIEGVRDLLAQDDEQRKMPIVGTVPKPKVGRSAQEQAALARRLWSAGDGTYDFIKDDENLTSLPFNKFDDRVRVVHKAKQEVEKETGHKKLYLCNITHSDINKMIKRAEMIKENGGNCLMIDVVTTGFAAVHTIRMNNPSLAIHAHRAMHGFITRESPEGIKGEGKLLGFSVSMIVLAKIFRLLGVDSLHSGSPKAKMEDYGESEEIARILTSGISSPNPKFNTLGQKWFGIKKVWPTASGGLHPGVLDKVIGKFGKNCYIQLGGGVMGHPQGAERGAEAVLEARKIIAEGGTLQSYIKKNPASSLAKAVDFWGNEPKIVY